MNNDFKNLNRAIGSSRDLTIDFIRKRQSLLEIKPNPSLNDSGGPINDKVAT